MILSEHIVRIGLIFRSAYILPSFMVHLVIFCIDQFRDWDDFVSFVIETGDDARERVFCIFGTVVHEDDRTVAEMFVVEDFGDDRVGTVVLPVKAVIT